MKITFIYSELILNCSNNINNDFLDTLNISLGKCFDDSSINENQIFSINKKINVKKKSFNDKNIGKLLYIYHNKNKSFKLFGDQFVKYNRVKAKIIIDNKIKVLRGNIEFYINKIKVRDIYNFIKIKIKIKIKFLDIIDNIDSIFEGCESLYKSQISKFNTQYLKSLKQLFYKCTSLISIDDISKWNINKVNNISGLFYNCCNLKSLPDISKWNTNNISDMSYLFYNCSSLQPLPDISKWNTSNVKNMYALLSKCSSLKILPDISKWNTGNVNIF